MIASIHGYQVNEAETAVFEDPISVWVDGKGLPGTTLVALQLEREDVVLVEELSLLLGYYAICFDLRDFASTTGTMEALI